MQLFMLNLEVIFRSREKERRENFAHFEKDVFLRKMTPFKYLVIFNAMAKT